MIVFHMHGHIASSRVCVHGVGYSPFLVNVWCARKWDNVQNRDLRLYKTIRILNHVCLGEARCGRSPLPRVKDPNFILGQTYVSSDESLQKCQKACKA